MKFYKLGLFVLAIVFTAVAVSGLTIRGGVFFD